jgi:hypothetical protein
MVLFFCVAACALRPSPAPQSGTLLLDNPHFGPMNVEAVITSNPDCASHGPGYVSTLEFVLPNNATKIIDVPPGDEICWRRDRNPERPVAGQWSDWDRAFVEPGTTVQSNL